MPPGYTLSVPDDVPETIVLVEKDGTRHEGNGRQLYANGHLDGWRRCWEEYQCGRVDPRAERAAERYTPQEYMVVAQGFRAGFRACQGYICEQP